MLFRIITMFLNILLEILETAKFLNSKELVQVELH